MPVVTAFKTSEIYYIPFTLKIPKNYENAIANFQSRVFQQVNPIKSSHSNILGKMRNGKQCHMGKTISSFMSYKAAIFDMIDCTH